jgi:DNA-directed RNA polymerase III subunit RPC1
VPKRFKNLKFGINSNQGIVNQAVLEVSDRMLYDVEKMRRPVPNGALDSRLVGLTESRYSDVLFG